MYFPNLPELQDTIISDVQIVYDSVSNLIVNTFRFGKVKKAASEKFRETGQFSRILEELLLTSLVTTYTTAPISKVVGAPQHHSYHQTA